jgi:hypothetical protein
VTAPTSSGPADRPDARASAAGRIIRRISRIEVIVALVAAVTLAVLVALEPAILDAPFASGRAAAFTFGGTALALVALVVMLLLRVPAPIRVIVLGVPFVAVNWWLLEPYFVDDVVNDEFAVSIAGAATDPPPVVEVDPPSAGAPTGVDPEGPAAAAPAPEPPLVPVLLGSGRFVGLAGHDGGGDAAVFALPEGGNVLRFENFAIDNGPDLRVYLVPGADRTSLADGAVDLGRLRGNVGDQTYDLPAGLDLTGPWTALVWCEAFSVEFVGATLLLT